jgi:GMP synthase-like glutamine amidotransferase
MRAHYLQHVPFEGLGSIEPWLLAAGYSVSCTPFFQSTNLPELTEVDLLIVMGGPMSVNDEREHPWLAIEKDYVRKAIEADKAVLGVCLGAQLIASASGSKVYPNPVKEIGWFPIENVPTQSENVFRFPDSVDVFHWHGETFDLQDEAVRLARSDGCENQAFQLGSSVIGIQFHLETTPAAAETLVSNCRNEIVPGKYVQSEDDILAASQAHCNTINALMDDVLTFLVRDF